MMTQEEHTEWLSKAGRAASDYVCANYSPIDIVAHGTLKQESALIRAFEAGAKWAAVIAARQPDGYFYRYHSSWRAGETFLSTETYHDGGLIETIPYYLGPAKKALEE